MIEWLTKELKSIKTSKFHLVEGGDLYFRKTVSEPELNLPGEYKNFVRKFGNSRFFRQSLLGYRLGVMAAPRQIAQNGSAYQVGYEDGKPIHLCEDSEAVFRKNLINPIADSFGSWFKSCYEQIKNEYSNLAWRTIVEGPRPFDSRETAVVKARENFRWQNLGLDGNGDRLLEIRNESELCIPCLSLGVRSLDGILNGAVIIEVSGLLPGESDVFSTACYKQFYSPTDLILFDLPKPGPEDRNYLQELKRLNNLSDVAN